MGKITYLDDLQQMQADHIWGKVRKMRKQKVAKEPKRRLSLGVAKTLHKGRVSNWGHCICYKPAPYQTYRRKVAARFAGRAGRVAQQLIKMGDY